MQTLAERLDNAGGHYTRLARRNYGFAYALVAATILSSAVAGIVAISSLLPALATGILALIPAFSSLERFPLFVNRGDSQ
jgi:hypothetical protein